MTTVRNSVALVTGGSRGIGRQLVAELYRRGAAKVYATARDPKTITHPDAIPVALEVTDPESVAAAARLAGDVTIVVNNAGGSSRAQLLTAPVDLIRRDFETNFYGPLHVARAFVPVIEANGGGHLLNVHSALSWLAEGHAYSASKAAFWSQTNSLRILLHERGISVTGLHVGYVDTDLTAKIDAPKIGVDVVAAKALDGIESGAHEVLVDEISEHVKSVLSAPLTALYTQLA